VIERESTKHGPRLDEDLERNVRPLLGGPPVEGRSEEGRMQEGPDEERLGAGTRPDLPHPGPLSEDELDRRAELAASLAPVHFPARREQIVAAADDYGIAGDDLESLRRLPARHSFANVEEIWTALGHPTESRST
jgi:hypothetical protein